MRLDQREIISSRAAAGAHFLDERDPGWWRRVRLSRLDVSSGMSCVLGQTYRGAHSVLGGYEFGSQLYGQENMIPLGFLASGDWCDVSSHAEYSALTEAWIVLVEKRRAEAGAMV